MRRWWLLALCACDSAFDLKQVPPPDAPPACFSTTPHISNCHAIVAPDIEDTYLAAENPDVPLGRQDALLLTASDPGLFKFDVSMIAAGEWIVDAQLELSVTSEANNCPKRMPTDSCGICTIAVTQWQLSWMTPMWDAQSATFDTRDGSTAWAANDRGTTVVGMVQGKEPVQGTPWILEATGDELAADAQTTPECWISSGMLAMQVTAGDAVAISSRYHKTAGCEGYPGAVLNLQVCQ